MVQSIDFSPDGKQLATVTEGGELRLWDTASQKMISELRGANRPLSGLAFSPDGTKLATADFYTLRVWRAPTPKDADKAGARGEGP